MKKGWVRLLLACILGVAAFGLTSVRRLKAQVLYGSVVGTITDPSGAAVPGAQVTITNVGTQLTRQVTSNSTGNYSVAELPGGSYTISVSAKGFKPLKETGIEVVAGSVNQQNLQLQVGAVTQEVTVRGSAAVLQTQTTNVHTTISSTAIENMPLNVYQNFQTLELLTPGTYSVSGLANSYPNSLADTPDRSLAINTNGLPQHINTTRVDGSTDVFLWLPDHMVIIPPAATIRTVNVQTADFGVQTGLTAGAATSVVTKTGTNDLHGEAYGFLTNDRLDAQNSFVHFTRKPKLIQDNPGIFLGGPIIKNKLFFFGGWDGFFQREAATDTNTIPYADMRAGNFSNYLGPALYDSSGNPIMVCTTAGNTVQLQEGMVFDPTTGNPATGQGRCVFQTGGQLNVIPPNRIYQGASSFWQLMNNYQPNQPGAFVENYVTGTVLPFNDIRERTQSWSRNIFEERTDWNISNRQTLWGKWTYQHAFLNDGSDYGVAGQGGGTGLTYDTANMINLGHTYTVSPNLVLSGHVGWTRMGEHNQTLDFGKEYGQTVLGLVNSNTPSTDTRYSGMPGLAFSGWSTLGTSQSWEPVWRNDWQLTLDEGATWMRGNHQITFGVDMAHNHMNHWQPEIDCCARGFADMYESSTFNNFTATGLPATFYTSSGSPVTLGAWPWNSIATFDLGLANVVDNTNQFIKATNKDWQMAFYIGDDWRATSKLTVNAGVRYEYYPLITRDGQSKFETYNPANNTELLGGIGGNPVHLGVTSQKDLFAPRLGLAYRLDPQTVVRSAFGITYDTLPLERPLRGFYPYTIGASNFVQIAGVSGNITQFIPYANFNASTNTANNIPGSPATATGLADGVPLIMPPVGFSSGVITPPGNVTVGTFGPGEHFKRGYVESWNFTVERKLPGDILLSAGYVGNHLVHQFNGIELNAATFGGGSASEPLFAAFGRTSDTYQFQGYLDSHYNSLQVSFERPMAQGLMFQGSYTWSKAITYMDDEGWEDGLMFNCPPSASMPQGCLSHNRGDPFFDRPQMLKVGFVYSLPFGPDRKFSSRNRAVNGILEGWQTNGIYTAMSGDPLTITGPNDLDTPFTGQTADFVGPLKMIGGTGPGQFWFNPSAFAPVTTVRFGTSGRGNSWLRGPGLGDMDFSVFRSFKLTERAKLKMELDILNLTNTPHYNDPSTSCALVSTGCGGSLGQIFSSYGQRITEVAATIDF